MAAERAAAVGALQLGWALWSSLAVRCGGACLLDYVGCPEVAVVAGTARQSVVLLVVADGAAGRQARFERHLGQKEAQDDTTAFPRHQGADEVTAWV